MTSTLPNSSISVQFGYQSGIIGAVTLLHAQYYALTHQFGLQFEARVAKEMAEYFFRYSEEISQTISLYDDDLLIGSISLDGLNAFEHGAHLRWFILDPSYQGQQMGSYLLDQAIHFARKKMYPSIHLDTIAELTAAGHLYRSRGFYPVSEKTGTQWGSSKTEQVLELKLT